jgi:hypothetical protein
MMDSPKRVFTMLLITNPSGFKAWRVFTFNQIIYPNFSKDIAEYLLLALEKQSKVRNQ